MSHQKDFQITNVNCSANPPRAMTKEGQELEFTEEQCARAQKYLEIGRITVAVVEYSECVNNFETTLL